jgi:hypothetical protein
VCITGAAEGVAAGGRTGSGGRGSRGRLGKSPGPLWGRGRMVGQRRGRCAVLPQWWQAGAVGLRARRWVVERQNEQKLDETEMEIAAGRT